MKKLNPRKAPTVAKGRARLSKRVTDRTKAVDSLLSAITGFKQEAETGYRARLGAELRDGETLPDQGLALELAGRTVRTAIDKLKQADRVYCQHVATRQVLSNACQRVARDEVYPELVAVRREIEMRFGREAGRGLHGLEGSTRRKPLRIQPQVERLVRRLSEWEMPEPLRPAPPGEREDWLRRLEPGSKKLTRLLKELQSSELREALLRDDRDFEMDSFDVDYAAALDYVRSVFRLAGLDTSWIWSLLPTVQRRRLKAKARQEAEARAEGRRAGAVPRRALRPVEK
jgi:hypothetical protein